MKCFCGSSRKTKESGNKSKYQQSQMSTTSSLNNKQKQYLSLIYADLANRSKTKKLTHSTFTSYFQLTGLWGDKLFKFFDLNGQKQITLDQFLIGIAKMVRAPEDQKVRTLFNFIKNTGDDGIRYKQFLKMLYHYSKPQLKEIMTSDGVFVHQAIIPSSTEMRKEKQSEVIHLKHQPSIQKIEAANENENHFQKAYQKISQGYQDPGTLLQFRTQKITYQVSYCNMSTLTKQYASHIFRKYNINKDRDAMNQEQFKDYIRGNMKLFDTYYAVFHQNLWGYVNKHPLFMKHIEKQSNIALVEGKVKQPAYLMLVFNALIISVDKDRKQNILKFIILAGIAVNEHGENGMLFKDEPEGNSSTLIQFNSSAECKQWLEQLKTYSNNYFQNKYQVLQSIGTGKFSVVYRCRQRQTGKQYALKVLQLDKLQPKQQASIQNQTQISKMLKSPNFIKQYETIRTKKMIYIVSEYVYGQDLYEYVKKKKRLPETQAAFLLGQIIQAVIHLHSLDIIHRDLKPENIMVSYKKPQKSQKIVPQDQSPLKIIKPKPERIKLIDFGFANYYSVFQQLHEEIPVGTLNYMAPEVLLGEKPTYQNDTFAIGSIFFFMLRGKYAFDSPNPKQTALLTIRGDYSLNDSVWEQVSDQAKQLIELLLRTDPNERITLKQALNHPFFKQLNDYNHNQT